MANIDFSFAHTPSIGAKPTTSESMAEVTGDYKTRITEGREAQKAKLEQIGADILAIKTDIREAKQGEFTPAQENIIKRLQERRDELIQQKQELREGIRAFGHEAKKLAKELAADQKEIDKLSKKVEKLSQKPHFIMRIFVGGTKTRALKAEDARVKAGQIKDMAKSQSSKLDQKKADYDVKIGQLQKQATRFKEASESRIALAGAANQARQEVTAKRQEFKEQVSKYPKETREKLTEKLGQLKAQETSLKALEYRMGKQPIKTDAEKSADDEDSFMGVSHAGLTEAQDHISTIQGEIEQLLSSSPQKESKTIRERITSLLTAILPASKPEKVDQARLMEEKDLLNKKMDQYIQDVVDAFGQKEGSKSEKELESQLGEIAKLGEKIGKYDLSDKSANTKESLVNIIKLKEMLTRPGIDAYQNACAYKVARDLTLFRALLSNYARKEAENVDWAKGARDTMAPDAFRASLTLKQSEVKQFADQMEKILEGFTNLPYPIEDKAVLEQINKAAGEFGKIMFAEHPEVAAKNFMDATKSASEVNQGITSAYTGDLSEKYAFRKVDDTGFARLKNAHEVLKKRDPANEDSYKELLNIFSELESELREASKIFKDQYAPTEEHGAYKIREGAVRTPAIQQAQAKLKAKLEELGERAVFISFEETEHNLTGLENPKTFGSYSLMQLTSSLNKMLKELSEWDQIPPSK